MTIDPKLAGKVQRMIRPEELSKNEPLLWSPGTGADVWELFFIDHGADLHARDEELHSTPLEYAARQGKQRMVLLRRGAKPHLPDDPPWATPLAWATRRGHDAIAQPAIF